MGGCRRPDLADMVVWQQGKGPCLVYRDEFHEFMDYF